MTFSNLILTWFTHFLGARTMFKHIFRLIMVTQKLSGVQLNHDNGFQVIELSKSIFRSGRISSVYIVGCGLWVGGWWVVTLFLNV